MLLLHLAHHCDEIFAEDFNLRGLVSAESENNDIRYGGNEPREGRTHRWQKRSITPRSARTKDTEIIRTAHFIII